MDYAAIVQMVQEAVPETGSLEYKAGEFLGRQNNQRDDLLKEVLAFANADGGRLVIGISTFQDREKKHLPERITPVVDRSLTVEWIQQVINTNAVPRFSNLSIEEVQCPEGGRVLVLDIGPALTAHQAPDYRYYQRAGLQVLPMSDFQIRDVMNRRAGPMVEVRLQHMHLERSSERHIVEYIPVLRNLGNITLERWRLALEFPRASVDEAELNQQAALHARQPIRREPLVVGDLPYIKVTFPSAIFESIDLHDLHPGDELALAASLGVVFQVRTVVDDRNFGVLQRYQPPIRWTVSSLHARPIRGEVPFEEWCLF